MRLSGWIFMITSWSAIFTFSAWCFYHVFKTRDNHGQDKHDEGEDERPPFQI